MFPIRAQWRLLVAACALFPLLACAPALQAQQPSEAVTLTPGAADIQLELIPNQPRQLTLQLPANSAARLIVDQTSGTAELTWSRQPTTPRTNPAGLGSQISILLLTDAAADTAEPAQLTLRTLSNAKPASVTLHLAPPHPTTPADLQQSSAETLFAEAEAIRLQRKISAYPTALAGYGQAASTFLALNNEPAAARALTWNALFLFVNQSDAAAALPIIQQAQAHAAALSPAEAANSLKVLGYVNVQLGHYDAGRAAYQQAIQIFTTTHDLFNQEVLLDNLSRVDRLLGDTDRALADAQQAESLAAQLGDVTRQLKNKAELGAIQIASSNLEAAYAEYRSSLALLETHPDPTTEAYVWSDLGVLYTQLHQPQQAADALDRALQLWKQSPNPVGEINTLDDLGELAMTQSQLPQARAFYQRGLTLANEKQLARDQVYLLRGLGATALLANDLPTAQTNLDQALTLALQIKEGDGLPEIYCLTGDLHARRHELPAAEAAYAQCRQTAAYASDSASLIRADGSVARLQLTENHPDLASETIERALTAIEQARTTLPEQDLRTSFFAGMHSYYGLAVDILVRLDQLHPGEGYGWQAFLVDERARSRMLLDRLHTNAAAPPSPALLAQQAAVQAAHRRTEARLPRNPALKTSLTRLRIEDHALSAEIATQAPSPTDTPAPLTLTALQSDLPPHSTFLAYWAGDTATYLWAVTPTTFKTYRLPAAQTLAAKAKPFTHLLLAPGIANPTLSAEQRAQQLPAQTQALQQAERTLRRALFPVGAIPAKTRILLLVPDGPLLTLPFAALTPSSTEILTEPSATFLHQLLARPTPPVQPTRIAVFADPSTSPSTQTLTRTAADPAAPIPYTLTEAASIRTVVGPAHTQILSGPNATPAAIRSLDWSPYTIAHFASHATLNRENLELTGLVLGLADAHSAETDRNILWYGDVCRLHIPLALVVLSACDTANGQSIPGEGLVGLTQAFFVAGAQRVLGALWPADDEATSTLMRFFYPALQTTHSPPVALRLAQAKLAAIPRWHAPYYWAGFSLAGDWRTLP